MKRHSSIGRAIGSQLAWGLSFLPLSGCNQEKDPAPAPAVHASDSEPPSPGREPKKSAESDDERESTATAPATSPPSDEARIEAIRNRYREVTTKNSLHLTTGSFECRGGEVHAQFRRYFDNGKLAQSAIEIAFAGHASEKYEFIYEHDELVFAIENEGSWGFTEGAPDENTEDTITQKRYYFDNGKTFRCLKKYAKGPTKQIDALLERAPNVKDDCSSAPRIEKLAQAMREDGSMRIEDILCAD